MVLQPAWVLSYAGCVDRRSLSGRTGIGSMVRAVAVSSHIAGRIDPEVQ